MKPRAIVTVPPHADFLADVAAHPAVGGLRLNTVMPLAESHEDALRRLADLGQPLWVDLKGRQLRVSEAAVPPFTELRVSHDLRVRTPAWARVGDAQVRVLAVEGRRLILEDGPRRVVGPGESINIPDPSLEIEGVLTESDRDYLRAMRSLGLRRVMLSFVEGPADLAAVRAELPDAELIAKIESRRGLTYVHAGASREARLLAARGDLYHELRRPQDLPRALRQVIAADPDAIAASRILNALAWDAEPPAAEISDVAYLLSLGYRWLMLGDEVCLRRESVLAALDLLEDLFRDAPLPEPAACA